MSKYRFHLRLWSLPIAICLAVACSSTGFSGSSGNKSGKSSENGSKKKGGKGSSDNDLGINSGDNDNDTGSGGPSDASDTGSGGPFTEILENGQVRQTFRGESNKISRSVDIVFAMDTSGSMGEEQASLETNMALFISKFETDAKAVDYRIYMIGENFNFPGAGDKIVKVVQRVGSHNALLVLQDFLSGVIPNPTPFRQDSLKQIVVVTDDEAEAGSGPTFKSFLQATPAFQGKTKFNGFIGLPTSVPNASCDVAGIGQQYMTLGSDPQVGGLIQDICSPDWSKLLKDLAGSIITDVTRGSFKLDYPVDGSTSIEVTVNGAAVAPGVASYEAGSQSLVFVKGQEPPAGAEVVVTYTRM